MRTRVRLLTLKVCLDPVFSLQTGCCYAIGVCKSRSVELCRLTITIASMVDAEVCIQFTCCVLYAFRFPHYLLV